MNMILFDIFIYNLLKGLTDDIKVITYKDSMSHRKSGKKIPGSIMFAISTMAEKDLWVMTGRDMKMSSFYYFSVAFCLISKDLKY